ncbi:uncharacterized protein F4807DRAFT_291834 [Annulohypoxylon truncatum]|uniref:uncharacterized protein n=1 Tax=Annulohypoxylon truncatum TaxID=327061 RepID=UPI00200788BA|nr:uncharacterized protein F4807DRAFT_291834 [Annulohypoxylon truncatum]KAI1205264.1 hypothetical protein F4807DRAFT_291834 [Annulohypoxylon truncatum]
MRFSLTIIATLFAVASAIPAGSDMLLPLEPRCLATGVDCTFDVNACCNGVCSENEGCGCLTCN